MGTDLTQDMRLSLSAQVAEEIRVVMTRRRVKQSDLARTLGKSEQWVSVRLRGVQPIDLNDLQLIAAALDVEVAELLPRPTEGRLTTYATTRGITHAVTNDRSKRLTGRPRPIGRPLGAQPDQSTRRPVRTRAAYAV